MSDKAWMQQALLLAQQAEAADEVPVGALVVFKDEIIGRGFNQPISACDPTAHAEVVAMRDAAKVIGNYRLKDATLYVTIEPCSMCAGALVHSRIGRVVFGATEPRAGAVVSQAHFLDAPYLNHRVVYEGGVCAKECGELVSSFFARRRLQAK
jgi:tRNA(adenine34) deaminase